MFGSKKSLELWRDSIPRLANTLAMISEVLNSFFRAETRSLGGFLIFQCKRG